MDCNQSELLLVSILPVALHESLCFHYTALHCTALLWLTAGLCVKLMVVHSYVLLQLAWLRCLSVIIALLEDCLRVQEW